MAKYKVWNDNIFPYKETFKDEKILIPPKEFIVMEEDDAFMFKGTFSQPVLDVDGNHTAQGFKMIRLERQDTAEVEAPKDLGHRCIACGYKGTSEADVTEHAKASHAESIVVDEEAEAELKRKRKRAAS